MIPKIIHYVWIGGAPMPELAVRCIASWKKYMPNWEYKRWDEDSLTRVLNQLIPNPYHEGRGVNRSWLDYMPTYVRQAYEAQKFAFVSDYVRLWALEQYGGLYMDVDFEVYRPFDDLMDKYPAFAGYEGSKYNPVMMGVIASEPHGAWVRDMLETYQVRKFILLDGRLDMTPNTAYFYERMKERGFVADGIEKDVYVNSEFFLHVLPVHYFCPGLTTGENIRNEETYCEHMKLGSWDTRKTWRSYVVRMVGPKMKTLLIKWKRRILG